MSWAGIDPSHLDLQHVVKTTPPWGLLVKATTFLSYLILFFYLLINSYLLPSSKHLVATGRTWNCHFDMKHFGFTTITRRLFLNGHSFQSCLILAFYIVINLQPSPSSKQFVGTDGNWPLPLTLGTLWLDHYTTKAISECASFSIMLNPCLLHCN